MFNPESTPPSHDPLAIEVFIGLKEFNGLPSRYLPATLANQLAAASGATVFQLLNEAGKQICERAFPGERDGEFANVLAWTAVKIRNSHWKVREMSTQTGSLGSKGESAGTTASRRGISARPFILQANSQATGPRAVVRDGALGSHFFSNAVQFWTSVSGTGDFCSCSVATRKRWPSAETLYL